MTQRKYIAKEILLPLIMMYDLTVVSRPWFSHVKRTDNINSENIKEKSAIINSGQFS